MKYRNMMKGALTYVPGIVSLTERRKGGSTVSPEYCYGVWIKHLTLLHVSGMRAMPSRMIELGPGRTIGVGICALLSGVDCYTAVDVSRHAHSEENIVVYDELIKRFRERAPYPQQPEIRDIARCLDAKGFPGSILTDAVLKKSMSDMRLEEIRRNLRSPRGMVEYVAPWTDSAAVEEGSVDLILSHSVMEHVNDPRQMYRVMARWCKPGAYMSHSIDYASHATAGKWYGHWMYSKTEWKLICGRRPYLINRYAHSHHRSFQEETGFAILNEYRATATDVPDRGTLRVDLREGDMECMGAVIVSTKKSA